MGKKQDWAKTAAQVQRNRLSMLINLLTSLLHISSCLSGRLWMAENLKDSET